MTNTPPRKGMSTPWGQADHVSRILEGMCRVGTPSHGGIKLNRERNAQVPDYIRRDGGWYEEDCEWAIPFIVFDDELARITETDDPYTYRTVSQGEPIKTFLMWFPDEYERFFAVKIQPGESYKRDQQLFYQEFANKWVAISALGDWHSEVPTGLVQLTASRGASRKLGAIVREYLVPKSEYEQRNQFGFVIDEARHKQV